MASEVLKFCPKCEQWKSLDLFSKNKTKRDGLQSYCKKCLAPYAQTPKARATQMQYRGNNKAKIKLRDEKYREKNVEKTKLYDAGYYLENKATILAKVKVYREANWEKIKAAKRIAWKRNYYGNLHYKVGKLMSGAIYKALLSKKGGSSWLSLVEYSVNDLINHLQSQFQPGMTWENWGSGAGQWQIDHKIPRSWFVYSSPYDIGFKMCWALDNLQPLWAEENRKKGDNL